MRVEHTKYQAGLIALQSIVNFQAPKEISVSRVEGGAFIMVGNGDECIQLTLNKDEMKALKESVLHE